MPCSVDKPRGEHKPQRRRAAVVAFTLASATTLSACEDEVVRRVEPPDVQTDELKQRPAALVDILWVVDNSESMVQEQEALAVNFNRFITGLTICQGTDAPDDRCDFQTKKCTVSGAECNPPDYHIGVIATDVTSPTDSGRLRRVGLCVPAAGSAPSGGKFRYCQSPTDCVHDAANPQSDPANVTCDTMQGASFITPSTPGAEGAFARAVQVGVGGSGLERGIEAASMALGRASDRMGQFLPIAPENAGFIRPDASLFVIFVSDEDDSSFGRVSYFYRVFESLKRAGNEGLVSFSAIVGDPDTDGETGPNRGGCPAAPSEPTAAPGMRYIGLAMYSRGLSSEFRVCDDTRLTCDTESTCQSPVPDLPGVCVPTTQCTTDQDCGNFKCGDRGCIACENGACNLTPERFVTLLERNGIFGSICAPDYGSVLGALGFEAAGLRRKFEITKFPDCAADEVPCGGTEAEPVTAPICVKVNGQIIPNDRTKGWVYEPGSNSIFFDGEFVPPTDATIEVSYRVSSQDEQLSCTDKLN